MLLLLAFRTHAAAVLETETCKRQAVDLADAAAGVVERVHEPVLLKFGALQVGPEMVVAVRNQACQAGFHGPAGRVQTGVAGHVLWRQVVKRLGFCLMFQAILDILLKFCHVDVQLKGSLSENHARDKLLCARSKLKKWPSTI